MNTVLFPGLGLEFELNRVALQLGDFSIYWYGVIIATGFLLAVLYCQQKAPKLGVDEDHFIDMLFFAVPFSIIGARIYYVVFYLDLFKDEAGQYDFMKMIDIRDGGIAIYGAVIAAFITVYIYCKIRKISFLAVADVGVFGLLIGQCIGRWGNFVNVEAFGGPSDGLFRMGIQVSGVYTEVHPTFLYESVWNFIGFFLLMLISVKFLKFQGQITLSYFAWYGLGRGVIEGMRTDSLYFFDTSIRVSQVFGFVTAAISIVLLIVFLVQGKSNLLPPIGTSKGEAEAATVDEITQQKETVTESQPSHETSDTKEMEEELELQDIMEEFR